MVHSLRRALRTGVESRFRKALEGLNVSRKETAVAFQSVLIVGKGRTGKYR